MTSFLRGRNDLVCGKGGRDVIRGGPGDDLLSGNRGRDRIIGVGGDDLIRGGRRNDRLNVGRKESGNDHVIGGLGDDILRTGRGRDRLFGNHGDDLLAEGHGDVGGTYSREASILTRAGPAPRTASETVRSGPRESRA
jgi:Ca2+-binding RTX toxin-like protein